MKHCPVCRLSYSDRIDFCFADGAVLISDQQGADDVPSARVAPRAAAPVFAPPGVATPARPVLGTVPSPVLGTVPSPVLGTVPSPVRAPAPAGPAAIPAAPVGAEAPREDEDLPEIPFAAIEEAPPVLVAEPAIEAEAGATPVVAPERAPERAPEPVPEPVSPPLGPPPASAAAPVAAVPVAPGPAYPAAPGGAKPYVPPDAAPEAALDTAPARGSGMGMWIGAVGLLALAVGLVVKVVTPSGDDGLAERPPPPVRGPTPASADAEGNPAAPASAAPVGKSIQPSAPPVAPPTPAAAKLEPPKPAAPTAAAGAAAAPKPVATTGALNVTSTPAGASVLVDGADRGVTPLALTLPLGAHTVEVALAGYTGASKSVDVVAAGGAAAFTLQAAPFDAMVLHKEYMGATLYIDGKPQEGRVPLKVKLTAGMHVFKLVKADGTETVVRKQVDNPDGKLAQVVLH
jgi:hypothetical protein